jgi:hypothetical protein
MSSWGSKGLMNIRGSVPTWVPRCRIDCDNACKVQRKLDPGVLSYSGAKGSRVAKTYPPLNPTCDAIRKFSIDAATAYE